MKTFQYLVKDELGIHARPAGLLVKEAKNFSSKITVKKDDKEADATRLMAVMALGVKKDMTVTVTVEGDDEAEAYTAIKKFFEEQL
ncbi:MAG: HPr family phosphocarrier protein [Roseburia sp.]